MSTPGAVGRRRVGDEERQNCAELLSDHHAHGRLSEEEFTDRLGAALAAQTAGDIGRLLADLPVRAEPEAEAPDADTDLARAQATQERKPAVSDRVFRFIAAYGLVVLVSLAAMLVTEFIEHEAIALVLIFSLIVGWIGVTIGRVSAGRNRQGRN